MEKFSAAEFLDCTEVGSTPPRVKCRYAVRTTKGELIPAVHNAVEATNIEELWKSLLNGNWIS